MAIGIVRRRFDIHQIYFHITNHLTVTLPRFNIRSVYGYIKYNFIWQTMNADFVVIQFIKYDVQLNLNS